ncbi:MAG: Hsp70 family protein [Lentisphaeria bacterium]|nr:Hsp70 family protein [Lentisphaeria bacterium]
MPESTSRFIIGIDLGTTNSAVCFIDTDAGPAVQTFPIPQLVDAAETRPQPLLPSFLYLPGEHELAQGALALPWREDNRHAVGVFAREQGARVPGRLVSSAKSWLAHGGVDREAPILPWHGDAGEAAVSPVTASRHFLEHIRRAWDHAFGADVDQDGTPCVMAEQTVIVTVPASFDEAARELTVQAAREAGLRRVTLLEEPLAAFYGWLARRETSWRDHLSAAETVLIVDIGGGTSDFSLVEVDDGDTLRRTAVGNHLLLGGDNMDMALARQVEAGWPGELDSRQWSALCHQCRAAKEALLTAGQADTFRISVSGAGRGVIASAKTATLTREQVVQTLLDGFFPAVSPGEPPPAKRSGIRQMGLPYVADPAVTRHLAAFLRGAANTLPPERVSAAGYANPSHVLFNGGSMLPSILRGRLRAALGELLGGPPLPELVSDDLTRAVAMGAAYYGRVRRGDGVRVKGGIARSYFIELEIDGDHRLMCVMPRERQENEPVRLRDHSFSLTTNQEVRFRLHSSSTRLGDRPGDMVDSAGDLTLLPPLHTIIRHGGARHGDVRVTLESMLNEVGTLDIHCVTTDGHHKYPLRFNVRAVESDQGTAPGPIEKIVDQATLEAALTVLRDAFSQEKKLDTLFKDLERTLTLPRDDWGAGLLRRLADVMLLEADWRTRTPRREARWLNVTGFCLRPGFGAPGDEERCHLLWKLWHDGPAFPNKAQVMSEWWILWRRIAGGLREGHQQQIAGAAFKHVTGAGGAPVLSADGAAGHILREQWRCLAALERLPVKRKLSLLKKLIAQPLPEPHFYWVIARLAARRPLHGPEDRIIPAQDLIPTLEYLLHADPPPSSQGRRLLSLALATAAAPCGIRGLDIPEEIKRRVEEKLRHLESPDLLERLLGGDIRTTAQTGELLGDTLPLGLKIVT